MRTQRLLFILLAALGLAAAPAAARAQSLRLAQPNAARFPRVTLYAYPTDASGALVPGLRPDDFRITENGEPAPVVGFNTNGSALEVCLALDSSLSMTQDERLRYARLAAREFLRHLGPQDRAAVITFAGSSRLEQALTGDRQALEDAVERARPTGNSTAYLDAVYWAITQVSLDGSRGGSVVGAAAVRPDARRVVLVLTDGEDNSSRAMPRDLVRFARANGVSICTVALGSEAGLWHMQHLAAETGGLSLRAPGPEDLERLYRALADQFRREYRIEIRTPYPEKDGTRREVRVEIAGGLYGTTWYQAPGQGSLLITVPGAVEPSAPVSGTTAGKAPVTPGLIWGGLMALGGLVLCLAAGLFWLGARRGRRLPIVASNPKIDLLPLWVKEGRTRVGRDPEECELVLDSRRVSRVHACIEAADGGYRVLDQGSINGTYVNGQRVEGERELRVGDVVRFGDREFRFAGAIAEQL